MEISANGLFRVEYQSAEAASASDTQVQRQQVILHIFVYFSRLFSQLRENFLKYTNTKGKQADAADSTLSVSFSDNYCCNAELQPCIFFLYLVADWTRRVMPAIVYGEAGRPPRIGSPIDNVSV